MVGPQQTFEKSKNSSKADSNYVDYTVLKFKTTLNLILTITGSSPTNTLLPTETTIWLTSAVQVLSVV